MSVAEFNRFKDAVLTQLTEEDPNMAARTRRFWNAIGLQDLNFNRRDEVIQAVDAMALADLRRLTRGLAEADDLLQLSSEPLNVDIQDDATQATATGR